MSRAVRISGTTSISGSKSYPLIPTKPNPHSAEHEPVTSGTHQEVKAPRFMYSANTITPTEINNSERITGK